MATSSASARSRPEDRAPAARTGADAPRLQTGADPLPGMHRFSLGMVDHIDEMPGRKRDALAKNRRARVLTQSR